MVKLLAVFEFLIFYFFEGSVSLIAPFTATSVLKNELGKPYFSINLAAFSISFKNSCRLSQVLSKSPILRADRVAELNFLNNAFFFSFSVCILFFSSLWYWSSSCITKIYYHIEFFLSISINVLIIYLLLIITIIWCITFSIEFTHLYCWNFIIIKYFTFYLINLKFVGCFTVDYWWILYCFLFFYVFRKLNWGL